jgi:hypothetical protein
MVEDFETVAERVEVGDGRDVKEGLPVLVLVRVEEAD